MRKKNSTNENQTKICTDVSIYRQIYKIIINLIPYVQIGKQRHEICENA